MDSFVYLLDKQNWFLGDWRSFPADKREKMINRGYLFREFLFCYAILPKYFFFGVFIPWCCFFFFFKQIGIVLLKKEKGRLNGCCEMRVFIWSQKFRNYEVRINWIFIKAHNCIFQVLMSRNFSDKRGEYRWLE